MLDQAKPGKLKKEDLNIAIEEISAGFDNRRDLYTALHVAGIAGSADQTETVQRYLWTPADPILSRIALLILCEYWGMSSKFLPELQSFLDGVDWDVDGDVREISISIAGRHLRETEKPTSLTQSLTSIATDEAELDFVREGALRALAVALGDSLLDVSSPAVRVRAGSAQAADVLTRTRRKYSLQHQ
ncbi:hypothetical protein [Kitasatospora purpeofusca]|uniref:hypothetical protein n=1 Tax=Kitasatospora purpeofusca TaxID=67352 RepID=UPI003F4ADE71